MARIMQYGTYSSFAIQEALAVLTENGIVQGNVPIPNSPRNRVHFRRSTQRYKLNSELCGVAKLATKA